MPKGTARPLRKRDWKSWFRSLFTAQGAVRGRPRRLRLESLERRWVRSSFTVTDNSDNAGDVNSLRYAINNLATGAAAITNTITIDGTLTGQTITLASLLEIDEGVTITGPGGAGVTINGNGTNGVLKVDAGVNAQIAGLTITGGAAASGGGILNQGTLSISNSVISGNSATGSGGGLSNDGGSLSIANCTISGNTSIGGGGGIYDRGDSVSITNSVISGNLGGTTGGGVCNFIGSLSIANSSLNGNTTNGAGGGVSNFDSLSIANSTVSGDVGDDNGGGVYNDGGTLSISNSTISGNSTTLYGGGINNQSGTLTIANSTISGNTTSNAGGGVSNYDLMAITNSTISGNAAAMVGGAILNAGWLSIGNSTISGNTANSGGGIYNADNLMLQNCIVSANSATIAADLVGGFTDNGNNLLGAALGGGSPPASDIFTDSPGLAPLGNYGGPTQTLGVLPGSPALGAGSATGSPATDQRGFNRPAGGPIDVGAYQNQGFTLTPAGSSSPQTALVNTGFSNPLQVDITANDGVDAVDGGEITFSATPGSNGQSAALSAASTTISSGQASVTATANGHAGAYTVSASPGTTGPTAFDLTNQATTNTAASSAQTMFQAGGQSVTLSATVTSAAGVVNDGTVTFTVKQGSTVIGTPTTSATVVAGAASVSYALPPGAAAEPYSIVASYNPGPEFLTSNDSTKTLNIVAGSVTGTVFSDLNGNGAQDSGESGLAGITVYLDLNNSGQFINSDPSAVTGGNGGYTINYISGGGHTIREDVAAGGASFTAPADGSASVNLTVAAPTASVNFGQIQTSVVLPVVSEPNLYSNNTTDAGISYVKSLYRAILDRSADGFLPNSQVHEYEYWVGVLNSLGGVGMTTARQAVATGIWSSAEHRLDEVASYYQSLLDRSASGDPASMFWVNDLEAGAGELSVVQGIMSSAEYLNRTAGNNALLLQNLLGALGLGTGSTTVTINGSVVDLLTGLNDGSLTRTQAVSDGVHSDQSLQAIVGSMYQAYLQRPVETNSGLPYWTGQVRTGGVEVAVSLLSSDEYLDDIQANL